MAKYTRRVVGSVVKAKEAGKGDYIKLRGDNADVLMKALARATKEKGLALSLESKKTQLESLEKAVSENKLSEENAEKARERINKIPDYVRFEIVLLEPKSE